MPTSPRRNAFIFTEILGEFDSTQWGDVGSSAPTQCGDSSEVDGPVRGIASLLIFERPEHLGDFGARDLAGGVQLAVGAGDDPGGHHAC